MAKQRTSKKTIRVKPVPAGSAAGRTASKGTRAAKAVPSKTPPGKQELIALLDQLEESDVDWLITQARTMIYNHKVEEVNQAALDLVKTRGRTRPRAEDVHAAGEPVIDVVPAGGPKSFNIILGRARLFINLDELKALVKIAQSTGDSADGAGRIFRWMQRERGDMVNDGSIAGPSDVRLKEVHRILRERFTVG